MAEAKEYPVGQICIVMLCELCDSKEDVNWFCKNCIKNLCDNCKKIHSKIPSCEYHDIGTIGEGRRASRREVHLCQKHGELMQYYCITCSAADVCVKCAGSEHQRHEIVNNASIVEQDKKELKKLLEEKAKQCAILQRMQRAFKKSKLSSLQSIAEARIDISSRWEEMEKVKTDLETQLDNEERDMKTRIVTNEQHLNRVYSDLQKAVEKTDIGHLENPPLSLIRESKSELNAVHVPETLIFPMPLVFVASSTDLNAEQLFGYLQVQDVLNVSITKFSEKCLHLKGQKFRKKLKVISKFSLEGGYVYDIVATNGAKAWIATHDATLRYVEATGKVLKRTFLKPGAVFLALSASGEILISHGFAQPHQNNVKIIKPDNSVHVFADFTEFRCVLGICCSSDGGIVCVAEYREALSKFCIVKVNANGRVQWTMDNGEMDTYNRFVQLSPSGNFYFKTSTGVCFVDEDGNEVHREDLEMDMRNVGPIIFDHYNNMIVGKYDASVVVLDEHFNTLKKYSLKGEQGEIFSLDVDDKDYLWIGTLSGYVHIVSYLET